MNCPGCNLELGHMPKDDIYYCFNVECKLYSREQRFVKEALIEAKTEVRATNGNLVTEEEKQK